MVHETARDGRARLLATIHRLGWRGCAAALSTRERRVLELRLGLTTGVPVTQPQVARRLGLSVSGVARIEQRARAKVLARASEAP
jgi:DNA-directed RNA polymerase sigma subunit (sigma70/sigma32)